MTVLVLWIQEYLAVTDHWCRQYKSAHHLMAKRNSVALPVFYKQDEKPPMLLRQRMLPALPQREALTVF
jgi:hypothetical protein